MKTILAFMMITSLMFSSPTENTKQQLKVTVTATQQIDCQCPEYMTVTMYDISNQVGYLPQTVAYTGPGVYEFYFNVSDNYGYRRVEVDVTDDVGNICDEANKNYFKDCYNHPIDIIVCD